MTNQIITSILAALLMTGCGAGTPPVPILGENAQELSMSILVDGKNRNVRIFHAADITNDQAARIASAAIADRLAKPTWLEGRFGIEDMLAVIESTGPENEAFFVDVCVRADGDFDESLCSRYSAAGEEEESAPEVEAGENEADGQDAPKAEPRNGINQD